jgi:hypothetical protein
MMMDPANCRLVQASGHVFPVMAVTSGLTAKVITGDKLLHASSSSSSGPASVAVDVKVPSGFSAAAMSAGIGASTPSHSPAVHQQTGPPSAVPAKLQEQAVISSVSPTLVSKLTLFFQLLLQWYKVVLNPSKVLPNTSTRVEHHLQTRFPPIASPFCQLDAQKLAAAKAELTALEDDRIIRRSNSPWASPLHKVKKPDRSWRCYGEYSWPTRCRT